MDVCSQHCTHKIVSDFLLRFPCEGKIQEGAKSYRWGDLDLSGEICHGVTELIQWMNSPFGSAFQHKSIPLFWILQLSMKDWRCNFQPIFRCFLTSKVRHFLEIEWMCMNQGFLANNGSFISVLGGTGQWNRRLSANHAGLVLAKKSVKVKVACQGGFSV